MSASWDGIPDPDEKVFGWLDLRSGSVGSCTASLDEIRSDLGVRQNDYYAIVAWVDGQHIRVPGGDPPKPAPVVTVDGVECEQVGWLVVERRQPRSSYSLLHYKPSPEMYDTTRLRVAAVVLLPEEGTDG